MLLVRDYKKGMKYSVENNITAWRHSGRLKILILYRQTNCFFSTVNVLKCELSSNCRDTPFNSFNCSLEEFREIWLHCLIRE